MVDDVAFQLILFCATHPHHQFSHIHLFTLSKLHFLSVSKNFIPEIIYVPVRLSIHDTLAYCILHSHPSIFTGMPT